MRRSLRISISLWLAAVVLLLCMFLVIMCSANLGPQRPHQLAGYSMRG